MREFKVKEKCKKCNGSGLYSGMGERDNSAVVCYNCKGTGCHEFVHEYEEFESRTSVKGKVDRVFEANPGICIGTGNGHSLEDFGGISYENWLDGDKFPKKSEMREFTCPAWWYQTADYDKKPDWKECNFGGTFSGCEHFCNKEKCWERFDKENKS